jgi:hypothetical protein
MITDCCQTSLGVAMAPVWTQTKKDGRGAGIRTRDLFVPNEARYQAALLPAACCNHAIIDSIRSFWRYFPDE